MNSYEEQMSDSDSEGDSSRSSGSQETFKEPSEKRKTHNVLEQNRRNTLRNSFSMLARYILSNRPPGEKLSRAQTLKLAIQVIKSKERKRESRLRDIRNLQKENAFLEEQYIALKIADKAGDADRVNSILKAIDKVLENTYDSEPSDSEDEDDHPGDEDEDAGDEDEDAGDEDEDAGDEDEDAGDEDEDAGDDSIGSGNEGPADPRVDFSSDDEDGDANGFGMEDPAIPRMDYSSDSDYENQFKQVWSVIVPEGPEASDLDGSSEYSSSDND